MAEAEDNQDQSMEEILQSIKRIIADDDDDETEAGASAESTPMEAASQEDDSVLELTELVQDDGSVTHIEEEEQTADNAPLTMPQEERVSADESMSAPSSSAADEIDSLLSSEVAEASKNALDSLITPPPQQPKPAPVTPSAPFRSGATVEDLTMEALRPMLKEWLDTNLQGIVERTVEREVRRISGN